MATSTHVLFPIFPKESWLLEWIRILVRYVWTDKYDLNTDTCGHGNVLMRKEKSWGFKNTRIHVEGGPNCNNNVQNVPCDNLIIIWPSILVVYLNKCFICYEDFRRLSLSFLRVISMEFLLVVLTVYKTVVMRIKGMITEGESYWYFDIFSLLLLQEMHRDSKWEFEFLSEGLKGYVLWYFFKRMLAAMLATIRGYIHTAPDEFSTGWKFVRFRVEFTRNPLNRRKIKTPSRSKLRVNNAKILNGPVWTNCPVKFLDQFRFLGNCPPTPPLTRS